MIYRNIKNGKILKMSESAYSFLGKQDQEDIKPYEKPNVEIPNVLKEIKQTTENQIIQPKKRGRHAKV
jgi:hypothetical protein